MYIVMKLVVVQAIIGLKGMQLVKKRQMN